MKFGLPARADFQFHSVVSGCPNSSFCLFEYVDSTTKQAAGGRHSQRVNTSFGVPKMAQIGPIMIFWTAQGLIQPKGGKSGPGPGPKVRFENGPSIGPAQRKAGPNRPWAAKFRPKPIPKLETCPIGKVTMISVFIHY